MKTGEDSAINAGEKDRAATVLLDVLAESLRLLHPLLPFVTEEIYGKLPNTSPSEEGAPSVEGAGLLITARYPQFDERRCDAEGERDFSFLQELVRKIRTLRSECTIPPDRKLRVLVRLSGWQIQVLRQNEGLVKLLAGIGELNIEAVGADSGRPEGSIGMAGAGYEAFVFIAEAVDIAALKQKFNKELERDRNYIRGLQAKLANEQFVKNAPPELVAAEKVKLEESLARTGKIESYLYGL
jgi:valyl-tRNA synthetase